MNPGLLTKDKQGTTLSHSAHQGTSLIITQNTSFKGLYALDNMLWQKNKHTKKKLRAIHNLLFLV